MPKEDTQFKQGNPGRQEGAQNKLTKTVKETVLNVFNDLQEDKNVNLKAFGKKYPREFYQLAARLIPTELSGALKMTINVTEPDADE